MDCCYYFTNFFNNSFFPLFQHMFIKSVSLLTDKTDACPGPVFYDIIVLNKIAAKAIFNANNQRVFNWRAITSYVNPLL